MKLKTFFEIADEGVSVYVAIKIKGLESYLFAADGAFDKNDIKETELANYRVVEFRVWHGYFTVVVER